MKNILMMSAILYISIGYSQNIVLEHVLEDRTDVYPIGDIDGDGTPELIAVGIENDTQLTEIYDGATLELKWTFGYDNYEPENEENSDIKLASLKYMSSPFTDFNGDGNLDMFISLMIYGENRDDNAYGFVIHDIINNSTIYEFIYPDTLFSNQGGYAYIADIDGDGEVEIVSSLHTSDPYESITYIFSTGVPLGVNQQISLPDNYKLSQNYPNPFNPITTIEYEISHNGNVNVSIYNIRGQLVEKLVDGYNTTGKYSIQWKPQNVSSGQYFYQISVDGFVQTKKMVLLK
jgi:hypothetical protein